MSWKVVAEHAAGQEPSPDRVFQEMLHAPSSGLRKFGLFFNVISRSMKQIKCPQNQGTKR
jgi:hypothetical protein